MKEKDSSEEIGNRLREFGNKKFKSMVKFAEALETSKGTLNQYISGRNTPGPKLLNKLTQLGCDINFILTGEINNSRVSREKNELQKELDSFWDKLKALGIKDAKDLDKLYDNDNQYMIFAKDAIEKAIKLHNK